MKTDQPFSSLPDRACSASPDLQDAIRRRAEEIYVRNGRVPGRDLENWSQAEQEIRHEAALLERRTAIIVKVNGVQYVAEYHAESSEGYEPGEFGPGDPVPVRLEGGKMYVRRPNGRELETTIVQRVG